ncbi:hypothetical protein SNOG_05885 [Parastagonospora nodorum SN15]|uniref:DUF7082 domain-containing protein n=1 Tax=Phaeosphaeria nodorum (strain SN15 / ATCC MYA-4574 / FGSC 10173) TaxID=321614 RepID=Q0UQS9_PHANO|nr:hypothetical protein SNOG_05885 [Parastagonospora nodorum SN15]EAT86949.2 hypothetical protein SNOG_05885 [Parastagonospora nodorum SN15]
MFGTKKCVAALQKVDYDDDAHNYLLNVEVPPYPLTNAWNPTMMLKAANRRQEREPAFASSLSNTYSGAYNMSKQTSYASQLSQKGFAVPSGAGLTHTDFKLPQMSPSLPSYGHYSTVTHTSRNSASMAGPQSGASGYATSGALQTPVLVRATSISQTGGAATSQPFNPYSMYQSKAILKVDGDLDKMSEDWTQEELDAKRRLVEFKRSQHGSTITTSFAPVTPEARATRSICVSCIWWEEKDECFITSVDTIFLLEQLVNVRFTVEEKNRIRRNLEGFRPMTVSKAKLDSEAFFKVIMGFPNPKPRNIEKDVKVFSWKVLAQALKKIISKYVLCELLIHCWRRITSYHIDFNIPGRHVARSSECASKFFATIGISFDCINGIHTTPSSIQSISPPESISRP